MPPTPSKSKGNPTLAAALKTLKRLQEKHNGVVEPRAEIASSVRASTPLPDHHDVVGP